MRASVPVYYYATVRRTRRRTTDLVTAVHQLDVEIQEVSSSDTALVAVFSGAYDQANDMVVDLRHWGGRFWRPKAISNHVGDPWHISSTSELIELFGHQSKIWPYEEPSELDDPDISEVITTTRDTEIENAKQRCLDAILIDGVPFEPIAEPVYTFSTDNLNRFAFISLTPSNEISGHAADRIFRLDRFNAMVDQISHALDRKPTDEELERYRAHRVEVVGADLLKFDDEGLALTQQVKWFLLGFDAEFLRAADGPSLMAYVQLRDYFERRGASDFDLSHLASLSHQLVERASAVTAPNFRLRDTEQAAARWHRYAAEATALDSLPPVSF